MSLIVHCLLLLQTFSIPTFSFLKHQNVYFSKSVMTNLLTSNLIIEVYIAIGCIQMAVLVFSEFVPALE